MFDALLFSPDSRFLATVADGKGIRVARVATGEPWRDFPQPEAQSYALAFSRDGRTLFSAGKNKVIRVWELETGSLRRELPGHKAAVFALAVSPDGRSVVSTGEDGILLHHLAQAGKVAVGPPDVDGLWQSLAHVDAGKAERAAAELRGRSEIAVALLAEKLTPIAAVDTARLNRLIVDLDNPRYAVRREATNQLGQLGVLAEPALRKTLKGSPTLEVRRRVEQLLDQIDEGRLSVEELRALRAVELLAQLDARQLLEQLSRGAPGARLTEAARAALDRLPR